MLRISKLADYASVVMVCIVKHAPNHLSAKDISTKTALGLATVSKLLKLLTHAGLLSSTRGATGGYKLARPAAEISIIDMLGAIDGQSGMTQCSGMPGQHTCSRADVCGLSTNWQLISRAVTTALTGITLSDLSQSIASVAHINVSAITKLHSPRTQDTHAHE